MEITKGHIYVETKINMLITNFKLLGMIDENYIMFQYKLNDKTFFIQHYPHNRTQSAIFFELLNESPLWSIAYNIVCAPKYQGSTIYTNMVNFVISLDPNLINDFIGNSIALRHLLTSQYNELQNFTLTDISKKSLISYAEPAQTSANFKVQLYDYQKKTLGKMLQIERNQSNSTVTYTYNMLFKNEVNIIYDPISNSISNKERQFNIKTTGGVLSDDMGLGKTISSIALIDSNPLTNIPNFTKVSRNNNFTKIHTKATLVLCPSHLTKQWETEAKKCNPKLKVTTVVTKTSYNKLTFSDFMTSDIIIASFQLMQNFKFYPTLYYQYCSASGFDFSHRTSVLKQFLQDKLNTMERKDIELMENPIFEFFYFHRLILDEGHEIFGENLGAIALSKYMSRWILDIDASYFWYVSGTPFVNFRGVQNCAKFINMTLEDSERDVTISYPDAVLNFVNKEYIWNSILNKICIRHRQVDVEDQIQIPKYEEKTVWIKFTDLERELYNSKKNKVSDEALQQLCCHPLIVESSKKIFGDVEVDLTLMQDKLIEYHKKNYDTYNYRLGKLDKTNPSYFMLKKSYETQMSESKYLYTILEKMKCPDILDTENCSICMDKLDNPTLTSCGHLFCYDCLKLCLSDKKRCPLCKADLTGKDLLVMNKKVDENKEDINPLVQKYGSKLGKLISMIRTIAQNDDSRIIIFSVFNDMLALIGDTLAKNDIANCYVKGNVWRRNAAIRKFKEGKTDEGIENKVIMLSLENSASGTNLTEATHIFFVEPINKTREECKAIEAQAIARACRIGQKNTVNVVRILVADTIEETIYRKNYNNNAIVNITETTEKIIKSTNKEIVV